jgi:ADP-heptose:LPS heptosyltransferase
MPPSPLVIYHKQLGDLLLLEPSLAKLSAASQQPVRLSTRRSFLPLVSLMERVAGESGLRLSKASEVVSFSGNFHAGVKTLATSAPRKKLLVKNPLHIKPWHSIVYPQGAEYFPARNVYRAKSYFDAMPCEATVPFRAPRLQTPPAHWRHTDLPESYILLHPTSAWPSKSWPAESWAQVLDVLHEAKAGPFVITGGSARWEQEFAHTLCRNTSAPTVNLCGKTSLEQYLFTVSQARVVLCIDGSSGHLAAAFGRPSLTLFGETSHVVWHLETELSQTINPSGEAPNAKGSIQTIAIDTVTTRALTHIKSHGFQ